MKKSIYVKKKYANLVSKVVKEYGLKETPHVSMTIKPTTSCPLNVHGGYEWYKSPVKINIWFECPSLPENEIKTAILHELAHHIMCERHGFLQFREDLLNKPDFNIDAFQEKYDSDWHHSEEFYRIFLQLLIENNIPILHVMLCEGIIYKRCIQMLQKYFPNRYSCYKDIYEHINRHISLSWKKKDIMRDKLLKSNIDPLTLDLSRTDRYFEFLFGSFFGNKPFGQWQQYIKEKG